MKTEIYLLEEVVLAEQLTISSETLIVELSMTFTTLQAFCMPRSLQDFEDESVQDEFVTSTTFGYGCWKKVERKLQYVIFDKVGGGFDKHQFASAGTTIKNYWCLLKVETF